MAQQEKKAPELQQDPEIQDSENRTQQVKKAPELQDPEIRAELDRRAREEGETVIKSGAGGKTLEAQERLAEGRKKGGLSRATGSGNERAEGEGGVVIEPDEKKLKEVKKDLGRE
ncbi:hypothetical protein CFC21_034603 [Triticum aestivum]|uniref:Uncharacterized protein n=3 Tax=Triticum TaxID=4564 RepID=A0A9R0RFX5_TRITD|nr:late embryogenesis abundant protein EMB564-like [Triticum dicoccoides]XP_044336874.1 late embryogenesis abundant protein EMB564-like [Triticum aestivum]KAF7021703.1 hypothetical protein CFC21_034603 [Triticum aestivum]VAH58892.1 unnamed protein product [Triticum turgidum subsp. durum]